MDAKGIYDEGISISRNYERRKNNETERLYDIIKKVLEVIKQGKERLFKELKNRIGTEHFDRLSDEERLSLVDEFKLRDKDTEKAHVFLTQLFEPYIKKIASKVYHNLSYSLEYTDVLQETYVLFLTLLKKYNPNIAAFSYYIGKMLPQHMNRWAEKELVYSHANIPVDITEHALVDPTFSNSSLVDSYLNAYVLTKEYTDFIIERAQRHSRSATVKEVCLQYFLGRSSCSSIAIGLGISYHAVYEIIVKIKKELEEFFLGSVFSEYFITSTGITEKGA